jgi:hypothetical protein
MFIREQNPLQVQRSAEQERQGHQKQQQKYQQ